MVNLKKVSRAQWCLFALFIGFAFLMQNCQDDDALIYEENQTETELNAKGQPVKVTVCRHNVRKDTYSIVSVVAKNVQISTDVFYGQDEDGDGYPRKSECPEIVSSRVDGLWDCDDTNNSITINTYYLDSDGDGYGDPNNPVLACEVPSDGKDYVLNGTDCNDSNSSIYPNQGCTYVPDDNFEAYLEAIDMGDGFENDYVLTEYINKVTELNVSNKDIYDLTGIEDFTDLVKLECQLNSIVILDFSYNHELQELKCYDNNLTSLDVSNNDALKYLNCSNNPDLGTLDVTFNPNLETLNCYNIGLTSLNLSGNLNLLNLNCDNNNQLISIDVSKNTALKYLYLDSCGLTSLDVTKNTNLEGLYCSFNPDLGTLVVTENDKLAYLHCYNNGLTSLDLSGNPNLETLYCDNNNLESLDVSNNIYLTDLDCSENLLSSLDLSQIIALMILDCSDNPNLSCIKVNQNQLDNYNSWDWWKDPTAIYSLLCPPL